MDAQVAIGLAAPLSLALTAMASAFALGKAVSAAMDATARQPEASTKILVLGLIVVAGLVFSALSGLILSDGFGIIQSNESLTSQNLCENGFCKINSQDSTSITFVQQGEDTSPSSMISSNEIFTDLKIEKSTMPTKEFEHFGNKATLFAEKDSFIREGLKDTNEGSNKILRVMGSGPQTLSNNLL